MASLIMLTFLLVLLLVFPAFLPIGALSGFFQSPDPSNCSDVAFPPMGNSDVIIVSVSIDQSLRLPLTRGNAAFYLLIALVLI